MKGLRTGVGIAVVIISLLSVSFAQQQGGTLVMAAESMGDTLEVALWAFASSNSFEERHF